MNGKEIQFVGSSSSVPAHTHSASDITSGILPVSRGGTGVSSLSALKSQLGVSPFKTMTYTVNFESYYQSVERCNLGTACAYITISGNHGYNNEIKIAKSSLTSDSNVNSIQSSGTPVAINTNAQYGSAWVYAALTNDGQYVLFTNVTGGISAIFPNVTFSIFCYN